MSREQYQQYKTILNAQNNFEDAIKTFEHLPILNTEYELLDFAIYIALFQLQLYLYLQAIQKNRDATYHNIEEIKCGNW